MKKSTLIELIFLNYKLHERKDGSFWLRFCKNRAMELAKNVRKREDINCGVVAITLPESLQASSEADKRKILSFEVRHDFLGEVARKRTKTRCA